jgi:hypothetical protein
MVFHNVRILEEARAGSHPPAPERTLDVARLRRQLARQAAAGRDTFTLDTLLRECVVPTGSVMFRRTSCPPIPDWYLTLAIGDWPLYALTAEHGDIGYINEVLGVYRIHDQGFSWSRSPVQRSLDAIDACQQVDAHFGGRYRGVQQRLTLLHLRMALLYHGQGDDRKALFHVRRGVSMAARRPTSIPGMLSTGVRWLLDRRGPIRGHHVRDV